MLRILLALFVLIFIIPSPAATAAEISVYYPPDRTLVEEEYITVEGWLPDPEIETVTITVNDYNLYEVDLDEYYFYETVKLKEGLNTISIGGGRREIFYTAGKEEPPPGFLPVYGHIGLAYGCAECHEVDEGGFVSDDQPDQNCKWCHNDLFKDEKNMALASVHRPVREDSCLKCHLPHTSKQRGMLVDTIPGCRDCHQDVFDGLKTDRYVHGPLNVGNCRMCHTIHSSKQPSLLKQPAYELCTGCHSEITAGDKIPPGLKPHPMIMEGECRRCHFPHSSPNQKMLRFASNRLCYDCHKEKTKSFHEKHGFSIYICEKCHDLHRPTQPHLIVDNSRFLCLDCHSFADEAAFTHKFIQEGGCFICHTFHFAPLSADIASACLQCHGENDRIFELHRGIPIAESRCTLCHLPHQSEKSKMLMPVEHAPFEERKCLPCHLEGSVETRDTAPRLCITCHKKLDLEAAGTPNQVHPPFLEKSCDTCHTSHDSLEPFLLNNDEISLCMGCHRKMKRLTVMRPKSAHSAVIEGRCHSCHDGHFSDNSPLLKKEAGKLCLECHARTVAGPLGTGWSSTHKPVSEGKCRDCHFAHGSKKPALLKAEGPGLCKSCHQELSSVLEEGSPVSKHQPFTQGKCDSCHMPHGGSGKALTKQEVTVALCLKCHDRLNKGHRFFIPDEKEGRPGNSKEVGDCILCHDPHFSEKAFLLRKDDDLAASCGRCHDKEPALAGVHKNIPLADSRCILCHFPHNTNKEGMLLPVEHDPFGKRTCSACHLENSTGIKSEKIRLCLGCHKKQDLAARNAQPSKLHAPFQKEACTFCHQSHNAEERYLIRGGFMALCGGCHEAIRKATASGPASSHDSFLNGRCYSCHSAHFSENAALLLKTEEALCRDCHSDILKADSTREWKVQHKPVSNGQCRQCHLPHTSQNRGLLNKPNTHVCRDCHSGLISLLQAEENASRHKAFETGECRSCHSVHGSDSKALLKFATGRDFCFACHPAPGTKHHSYSYIQLSSKVDKEALKDNTCLVCHDPHISTNTALLKSRSDAGCRGCHQEGQGP